MKRVALITGGARGIGLGIAKKLAESDYSLVINGVRDQSQVSAVLEELIALGSDAIYCQADISKEEHREKLVAATLDKFGQLNLLVNNAGVAPLDRNDLLDVPEESFDRVMTINLKGPFFLTQRVASHMIDSKSENPNFDACIINIGSVSASMVSTNRGQYCMSKAGIAMMSQLFAARLGDFGIPVFEVRPGVIKTDMTAVVLEKYQKLVEEGTFVEPRLGASEDVGQVVAALATGNFPYSTGNIITVDGGLTIPRL